MRECRDRTRWPSALLLAGVLAATARAADDRHTVRHLGDPASLKIEGCSAIPAEQVRKALADDRDVQLASTPSASLGGFLGTLERQLLLGYHANGFPDARIRADLDPAGSAVVIKVEEGPRYLSGGLLVVGAKTIDARRFRESILNPPPPRNFPVMILPDENSVTVGPWLAESETAVSKPTPVWEEGKPAAFDAAAVESLRRAALRAACQQGHLWPKLDVAVRREPGGTATLVIALADEGPRATLDKVDAVGLQKHTVEPVARYLGLTPGLPIDLATLLDAQERLWASGRFLRHKLSAHAVVGAPGKAVLRLDAIEFHKAPALDAELSEPQRIALRSRDWWAGLHRRQQHLRVRVESDDLRIAGALDLDRGLAVRVSRPASRPASAPAAGAGPRERIVAFVMTRDRVGVYVPEHGRRFVADQLPARLSLTLKNVISADATAADPRFSFIVGAGVMSAKPDKPPFELDLAFSPAAFLDLASAEAGARIDAGVLTLTGKTGTVTRIEAATGRLLGIAGKTAEGDAFRVEVEVLPGALDKEIAALEELGRASANQYDARRPFGTLMSFWLQGFGPLLSLVFDSPPAQWDRAAGAAAHFFTPDLFADIEAVLASLPKPDPDRFRIPPANPLLDQNPTSAIVFAYAVPLVDRLFTRRSWPWTLARESCIFVAGTPRHLMRDELRRVAESPETGPLGHLACAELLARVDPRLSREAALRGLRAISEEEFLADCRTLLLEDSVMGSVLLRCLAQLQSLEEADLEALSLAFGQAAPEVRSLWVALRAHRGKPLRDSLEAVQRQWWAASLRGAVQARLRVLAHG